MDTENETFVRPNWTETTPFDRTQKIATEVIFQMRERIKKHGTAIWISNHEISGDVTEEYHELLDAIQRNKQEDVRNELWDVAIAALWGIISMDELGFLPPKKNV